MNFGAVRVEGWKKIKIYIYSQNTLVFASTTVVCSAVVCVRASVRASTLWRFCSRREHRFESDSVLCFIYTKVYSRTTARRCRACVYTHIYLSKYTRFFLRSVRSNRPLLRSFCNIIFRFFRRFNTLFRFFRFHSYTHAFCTTVRKEKNNEKIK